MKEVGGGGENLQPARGPILWQGWVEVGCKGQGLRRTNLIHGVNDLGHNLEIFSDEEDRPGVAPTIAIIRSGEDRDQLAARETLRAQGSAN